MESGYDHHHEDDDDEDFEEEVVWDVVRERTRDASPKPKNAFKDLSTAAATSSSTSSRMIPRNTTTASSSSSSSSSSRSSTAGTARQSAPVNIPDWSKIYQLNKNHHHHHHHHHPSAHDDGGGESYSNGGVLVEEEDDDDGSEGGKVPPHEWLAKKMARARISSFSVCEGAGRTLKGRDLSKVRNAVLTRTGFLEQ